MNIAQVSTAITSNPRLNRLSKVAHKSQKKARQLRLEVKFLLTDLFDLLTVLMFHRLCHPHFPLVPKTEENYEGTEICKYRGYNYCIAERPQGFIKKSARKIFSATLLYLYFKNDNITNGEQ